MAAQIGPKPGKKQSLAMLLDTPELPGDNWKVLDQRTWRTGIVSPRPDWAIRAKEAGSITAWRSFKQMSNKSRWMWTQVIPYVSNEDAECALSDSPKSMLRNLWAKVSLKSERIVEEYSIPDVSSQWVYEQQAAGPEGDSISRFVAGTVGGVLFMSACTGFDDAWSWSDVVALASTQARKIKEVLPAVE